MKEHAKVLIVVGACLLAMCASWLFFLYRPGLSRAAALSTESQRLMTQLRSLQVTDAQIAALEENVRSLESELGKMQSRVVPRDSLPAAVARIRRHAARYGIKPYKIIPDYDALVSAKENGIPASPVKPLTLHMKLRGRYLHLGRFLKHCGELPFLVSVGDLTLGYDERSYPELEILLDLRIFIREEAPMSQVARS